ncbi:DUF7344 domain-containing protein [Halosolutus gelatinilyticus]|uniref:DUF7344 domain-containing protein n=1 Tax=Halosolutus gelatinilyticus TaxID=2931975 RepID=UPI001FF26320|nr:hypothetical protein [Halosolutus gelatinilyticus]
MTSSDWPTDETPAESTRASDVEAPNCSLSLDAVFELLSDERSRRLLYVLSDLDGTAAIDDAVEHLAASGDEPAGTSPAPAAKRCVRTALHHATVPRLTDYGVVDYDPRGGVVTLTESGDRLQPYLAVARERDRADGRSVLGGATKTEW